MSLASSLIAFGLRQALDMPLDSLPGMLDNYFADHSQALPKAIAKANDRAWKTLAVALAGNGFLERLKAWVSPGDERGMRQQIQTFLADNGASFPGTSEEFRQKCLAELKQVRQGNWLKLTYEKLGEIKTQVASFRRYTDPAGLMGAAHVAVGRVADAVCEKCPSLAQLLRLPTPGGPPLLAVSFAFFLNREIDANEELSRGLLRDGLQRLGAAQAKSLEQLGQALASLGAKFDEALEQLDRIESAVGEARGAAVEARQAVLDLNVELQRLEGQRVGRDSEVGRLMREVMDRLDRLNMHRGEVQPQHSLSIHNEGERRAVKQLLLRFRAMAPQEQVQVPALLNGLGKLQVGIGDFAGAEQTFTAVAKQVGDPAAQAEAHYNTYRAALEEKDWLQALREMMKAAQLDPARFALFPPERYQAQRILGAGGFGTAFLCVDNLLHREVVVKALHAEVIDRTPEEVFREAGILDQLRHPAIIGLNGCDFTGPAHKRRPYIVMEYFPGQTLEDRVQAHGQLAPLDMIVIARLIAEGMEAAHARGVWHRDLKPANVLVKKSGTRWEVKIIDFGLALRRSAIDTTRDIQAMQSTLVGASGVGTIGYAAPEQLGKLTGVKVGPWSDVYSFGKLICYGLFKTTEPKSRHWDASSEHRPWQKLLERCTEEEVRQRPDSFTSVLRALTTQERSVPTTPVVEVRPEHLVTQPPPLPVPVVQALPVATPVPVVRPVTPRPSSIHRYADLPPRSGVRPRPRPRRSLIGAFFGCIFKLLVLVGILVLVFGGVIAYLTISPYSSSSWTTKKSTHTTGSGSTPYYQNNTPKHPATGNGVMPPVPAYYEKGKK
jgi:serine/threonine protein kinase